MKLIDLRFRIEKLVEQYGEEVLQLPLIQFYDERQSQTQHCQLGAWLELHVKSYLIEPQEAQMIDKEMAANSFTPHRAEYVLLK